MRVLGIAGLLLALAIGGYLIVTYVSEMGRTQDPLQRGPGDPTGTEQGHSADLTKRGVERRMAPVLEQERKRVEETNRVSGQ